MSTSEDKHIMTRESKRASAERVDVMSDDRILLKSVVILKITSSYHSLLEFVLDAQS